MKNEENLFSLKDIVVVHAYVDGVCLWLKYMTSKVILIHEEWDIYVFFARYVGGSCM